MAIPLHILLSLALSAFAEGPLYQGLPDTLPADLIQSAGFVDFQSIPGGVRAPIGSSFLFNGRSVPPTDHEALAEVFAQAFYAKLPAGTRIASSHDAQGRVVWNYPVGTRVAHLTTLNDAAGTFFDLRILEKQENGRWAYGVYWPDPAKPGTLALQQNDDRAPHAFTVELLGGKRIDVSMQRITIQSCRACHFMNSPSSRQYPNVAMAGPCHFVPDNVPGVKDWIQKYSARYGQSPVEDSPFRLFRKGKR